LAKNTLVPPPLPLWKPSGRGGTVGGFWGRLGDAGEVQAPARLEFDRVVVEEGAGSSD
jgi:hypothetical protein